MNKKRIIRKILQFLLIGMFLTGIIGLFLNDNEVSDTSLLSEMEKYFGETVREQMVAFYIPLLAYGDTHLVENDSLLVCLSSSIPLLTYCMEQPDTSWQVESKTTIEIILQNEARDEETPEEERPNLEIPENTEGILYVGNDMLNELEKENQMSGEEIVGLDGSIETSVEEAESEVAVTSGFTINETPVQEYQWEYYESFDNLISDFYAVDASTAADPAQINIENLLGKDMTLTTTNENPQILIYHTHSQEDFIDSIPGDSSTTIMGAGARLAEILRDDYGFNVIHHEGTYDVESRDYAYSNALPYVEQILEENPTIEVVIDECVIIRQRLETFIICRFGELV